VTYVLDTSAVSALMKGDRAVVERLAAVAPADVAIPQLREVTSCPVSRPASSAARQPT
jgi:hypothetical protein